MSWSYRGSNSALGVKSPSSRLRGFDGINSAISRRSSTATELYGANWYEKYTAGRMIQFNTASPYKNARSGIRAWLREPVDAALATHTVDAVLAAVTVDGDTPTQESDAR